MTKTARPTQKPITMESGGRNKAEWCENATEMLKCFIQIDLVYLYYPKKYILNGLK